MMVMQLFLLLSSDVNLVVLTFSSFKKMTTLMKICGSLAIVDDCHLKIAMIARPSEFAMIAKCKQGNPSCEVAAKWSKCASKPPFCHPSHLARL